MFRGLFTLATCILMPVETKASCRFELRGDGSGSSVLALNNQFWIEQKTSADDVWRNLAQPPARGGLVGCNVNTGKKEAAGRTVKVRLDQLQQQAAAQKVLKTQAPELLRQLSAKDLISFFDRKKALGEMEALQWAMNKQGRVFPPNADTRNAPLLH